MGLHVLILTSYKNLEVFQRRVDNRTLIWGLDQANIEWTLVQPWKEVPELSQFDAVFSTLYLPHQNNFPFYAKRIEDQCRELGIAVIQSADNITPLHSYFMDRWKQDGVPCANFCEFESFEDIDLAYPMILRKDGQHRGQNMFFVHSPEEAKEVLDKQYELSKDNHFDMIGPQMPNLAIEFVDTQNEEGFYEKWRCYVVDDEVIPAHYLRSKTRFVNYKDAILDAQTCATDQQYFQQGPVDKEVILKAAKSSGFDIITLDYGKRKDGSIIFWEGNRQRGTAGDPRINWLSIRPADLMYGKAVAKLIMKKVELTHSQA